MGRLRDAEYTGKIRLFTFLTTYFLLFGAKFKAFDVSVFFALMLGAYYIVSCLYKGSVRKDVLLLAAYLASILAYFSLVSLISDNEASPLLNEFGKMLLYLASACGLIRIYLRLYARNFEFFLLTDIYYSLIATAGLIVFLFLVPAARIELYSMLDLYIFYGREPSAITNRIVDLSIGGSTVSLMLLLTIVFLNDKSINPLETSSTPKKVLLYLLIILATILTGRTGFLLLVAYSLAIFAKVLVFHTLRAAKYLISGSVALILLVALGTATVTSDVVAQFFDQIAPWAFELAYTYINDGAVSSESGSYILKQYVIPETALGLIYGGGSYNVPYDSIFIKLLHSVGLIGVLLALAIFILPFISIYAKKSWSKKYLMIYMLIMLIGNLKETMLGNSRGAIILYFVLLIAAIYSIALSRGEEQFNNLEKV